MANLQYVGARYVPKFATPYEWDINATYEALTIVGYQGNSYTSKIPVPAGTQISNDTYWALTNSQSGAVSALQKQVNDLQSEVNDNMGDIATLQADVTRLEPNVKSNTAAINQVQKSTVLRHNKPSGLVNAVFVGDSYAVLENNWALRLTQKWNMEPESYVIAGENAAGFAAEGESGGTFVTLLSGVAAQKDEEWRKNVTHIVIMGGTNDRTNPSGTLAAMDNFANIVDTQFVNASVFLAYGSRNLSPDKILSCFNISATYQEGCYANNWNWCSNVESALALKSLIQADGVHPTSSGSRYLANALNNAILTGDGTTNWRSNQSGVSQHYYTEYVRDGMYFLHCTRNSVYTLASEVSGTTLLDLPALDSIYMSGPSQNLISVSTNIVLITEAGTITTQVAQVTFNSTGVHLVFASNITAKTIGITPFVLSVPVGLI